MSFRTLLSTILMLPLTPLMAEGIPLDPGLWEMTSTVNMPMMPAPRVTTETQCMETGEMSPDAMADDESDCAYEIEKIDGNTMSWTIECPSEMGTAVGRWTATSGGDTLTGEGEMTFSGGGMPDEMVMTMSWDGRRVGDCE